MQLTQAQLDSLYNVYQRWQDKTPHAIMPEEFEIVPDEEYRKGDYIGVWVGGHNDVDNTGLGQMFLGIESDGYTHS